MRKTRPPLENVVAHGVRQALIQRHWRVIRNNVTKVQFRPGVWTQFAEPGMPDFLALHYLNTRGNAVVLWVETKRLQQGRLTDEQTKWNQRELGYGGVVIVARSVDDFLAQYESRLGWIHDPPYSIPGHQSKLQLNGES